MDRISSLPDDVLIRILSLLSTKEAVQTCTISKRWRHMWAFVPVLKFDIDDWVNTIAKDDAILKEGEDKFEKFLYGVLNTRGRSKLHLFEYRNSIDDYHSEPSLNFLDRVTLLKPQVVSVEICRLNKLDLPDLIFSCKSLEILELIIYTDEEMSSIRPKSIHLPSLKNLALKGLDLNDDDSIMQKLSLGCPVLETLDLETCFLDVSEISSNVLKQLALYECDQSRQTRISCPHLVSLVIQSYDEIKGFELNNLASLEYASISINLDEDYDNVNLLSSLSNVSQLRLDLWGDEFKVKLEEDILDCRPLSKLESLEIGYWELSDNIDLVAGFIKNSPNLEELTLALCEGISNSVDDIGSSSEKDDPNGELSEQQLRDGSFEREYLKAVRIIRPKQQQDVVVDALINELRTLIKTIEEIIIT